MARKGYVPSDRDPTALVYFIQGEDEGPIKIGVALDPEKRVAELQTGYPYRLRLLRVATGGYALESALHRAFRAARTFGEWFRPVDLLLKVIHEPGYLEELAAEGAIPQRLAAAQCDICAVSLKQAYGKRWAYELRCEACIEAAPFREAEAA